MDYKDNDNNQNENKFLNDFYDYMEENGMRGAKRYAEADIAKWQAKRANMTKEELEEMEQQDELDKWTGKWMLIGIGVVLAAVCTLLIIGELTGNPLVV